MISTLVSAVVGFTAALATCLIVVFFFIKPAQPTQLEPPEREDVAEEEPFKGAPIPQIKLEDVKSISINTVYTGYFDKGNKCSKTYNEYFGDKDGIGSPSSPCTVKVTFEKDGHAAKFVEISRYDNTIKEKRVIETSVWTARTKPEEFLTLAQTIVTNDAFKSWRIGTTITVSNCSISVYHTQGTKTIMSNVGKDTPVFSPMVEGFKKLDGQLSWKKTE